MRYQYVLAAALALSACMPAAPPEDAESDQLALVTPSLVVPPGPVTVPTLPSITTPLGASQILCDSYQPARACVGANCAADDAELEGSLAEQCGATAQSVYKELQVALLSLSNPATVARGLAAITAHTTALFPDGSYTQGAAAFAAARPALFGTSTVTAIENKFVFKPINQDTVIVIGDPTYTQSGGATVDSVQYHVYTRGKYGKGACRSLSKLKGKVCWSEVASEWVYKQPFTGTSYSHAISTARSQIPSAASYPVVLESERIVCDGAFRGRAGDTQSCEQATREFYKEIEFQIIALTNPNTLTSGLAALNDATTFVYPTGLVTEGLAALGANIGGLFGTNFFTVGIENKFLYKALDQDTVLFIGDPLFTMFNFVTGQLKTVESVQLSVYRRNSTPLGNCRSATNLTGDVCWSELAEQWVYGQPVLGD